LKNSYHNQQDVLSFDLKGLLSSHFNNYCENNNSYYMACPFCGKKNKFYIQKKYKYFICFVCEEKGSIYRLLAHLKNIPSKEAYKIIHKIKEENLSYDDELKLKFVDEVYESESDVLNLDLSSLGFYSLLKFKENHEAREYIAHRGLDDNMIQHFNLHYCDRTKRVIFPVEFEDKIVGYQARDITGEQEPKILSSKGFQKTRFLYNYNKLLYDLPDYVVLVEGPIDCIKSYEYNSVALFGKHMSKDQLHLLLKIPTLKKVYIALDPEEEEGRFEMMKDLSAFWETLLVPVEIGKDIGMYSSWEIGMLLKRSQSIFDFGDQLNIEDK